MSPIKLKFGVGSVAAMLTLLPLCVTEAANGQTGLIAYYPMNGNGLDASGNGLHGTIEGNVTFVPAQIGQGAKFDGVNSRINLGNPSALRLAYPFSFSAAFRRESGGSVRGAILTHGCGGYVLYTGVPSRSLSFARQCGNGDFMGVDPAFQVDRFHSVIVAATGTTATIFVDGRELVSQAFSSSWAYGTNPVWIGDDPTANSAGFPEHFTGIIDEVRLFSRALSGCEVQLLAMQTVPPHLVHVLGCVTGPIDMAVEEVGTGPFAYEWQLFDSAVGLGGGWRTLVDGPSSMPAGSPAGSFTVGNAATRVVRMSNFYDGTLPNAPVGQLTLTLRGIVTNACGTATSDTATLTLCEADFNCSASLGVEDIFAFLQAWFAGDSRADVNGGGLSVQDIFDYLGAWFAGC